MDIEEIRKRFGLMDYKSVCQGFAVMKYEYSGIFGISQRKRKVVYLLLVVDDNGVRTESGDRQRV